MTLKLTSVLGREGFSDGWKLGDDDGIIEGDAIGDDDGISLGFGREIKTL